MRLPFDYVVRNMFQAPGRSLQLLAATAVVVGLLLSAAAVARGLSGAYLQAATPDTMLLLATGSEGSLERSSLPTAHAGMVAGGLPGIAQVAGQTALSPEIHYMGLVQAKTGEPLQSQWRGVTPTAFLVHAGARLITGNYPGPDEILVGSRSAARLGVPESALAIGESLHFEGRYWRISGQFEAPGVIGSEIWSRLDDLRLATRHDGISGIFLRLGQAEPADVELFCLQRLDLGLTALSAQRYYSRLAAFTEPIGGMAWAAAGLIALAAAFGALTTATAAFSSRMRELAVLQTLGFRRHGLLTNLLQESGILALAGTGLGASIALLLFHDRTVAIAGTVIRLQIDATSLLSITLAGLALGCLAALPSAWHCLRTPLPAALRQ